MVDFLVIGSMMSVTYKDIFPLIKDGDVNFGWNNVVEFEDGVKFGNIGWFTDMRNDYPPELVLSRKYVEGEYKKFDNTDIINIDKTKNIPYDYDGVMGVPITFLNKWNPGQFVFIGFFFNPPIDGVTKFHKILIKRK